MKTLKLMYEGLGNTKEQRFKRFWILFITVIVGLNLIFNVGYTTEKGFYWKPFEASYTGGSK